MDLTKNFKLQEFVPPEIYKEFGTSSTRFIHEKIPLIAQEIKEFSEYVTETNVPVIINDWLWGGVRKYSGFRPPDCIVGAKLSAHKRGMAIDVITKGLKASWLQERILEDPKPFMDMGITTIGLGSKEFTHLSCEYTGKNYIVTIEYF